MEELFLKIRLVTSSGQLLSLFLGIHMMPSWVYCKLKDWGCFNRHGNICDVIKCMRIMPVIRGQQTVLIECKDIGQNVELASVLYQKTLRDGVSNVQSLSRRQIPVYISWVRSSIDIQKYIIDDFLSKYVW